MSEVPMTDPRDRDEEPGLKFIAEAMPPQLVDYLVESCAAHSKSRGWVPAVRIKLTDINGAEFDVFLPVGPELDRIVASTAEAGRRAVLDAEAAERAGITALADDDEADDE